MVKIYATGNFELHCDGYKVANFVYLEDCMEYIRNHYNDCFEFMVSNGDTGEIYFEIIR